MVNHIPALLGILFMGPDPSEKIVELVLSHLTLEGDLDLDREFRGKGKRFRVTQVMTSCRSNGSMYFREIAIKLLLNQIVMKS
jgi:hypothetical protein